MSKNRLMLIVLGLLSLQAPLIAISPDSGQPARASDPADVGLSVHQNSGCDDRGLEWTSRVSVATGETITICFTPRSSAYIYIINESAEGTYMAYPQSADQLGPIDGQQRYAFDIVGEPGQEIFTFFVTLDPITHFDDAIRRNRLRLSRSQLLHGDGEALRIDPGVGSTDDADYIHESDRRRAESYWLIDSRKLESLAKDWLRQPGTGTTSRDGREGVRLNRGISNLVRETPQPVTYGVSHLSKGKALILEFPYDHRRQY